MKVNGPHFDVHAADSTFHVEFDEGLQLVFCAYTKAVPRPKPSYVILRSSWTTEQLARYNVHESEGGGKFCLVVGHDCGHELGECWQAAYDFLNVDNMSPTLRLAVTQEQRIAWDYVNGSLVYARRLNGG